VPKHSPNYKEKKCTKHRSLKTDPDTREVRKGEKERKQE